MTSTKFNFFTSLDINFIDLQGDLSKESDCSCNWTNPDAEPKFMTGYIEMKKSALDQDQTAKVPQPSVAAQENPTSLPSPIAVKAMVGGLRFLFGFLV